VLGVGGVDGCGAQGNQPCVFTVANPGNPTFPKASFSNFDNAVDGPDVKITAPAVELFTTYPGFGRLWATVSGTSFSTPLVAGEAALLVSKRQTGATNRTDIENSANHSIEANLGGGQGYGLINVLQALISVH
jgi:subtilisin family serine protease